MIIGDLVDQGFADIKTGPFGTQLRASDYVETGRPVLNVRNVGFGDVRAKDLEYADEETAARLSTHLLEVDDIVFGRKGAVERHAFISEDYAGAMQGSDCIRLRISESSPIPAAFITFALRTTQHQAWMKSYCSHGATMASLNQAIVRQIPLPDIGVREQRLAVEVLQTMDNLANTNRRRSQVLEEMARAIYREWFVHFRYPGHEGIPIVDTHRGPLPDGWRLQTLAAVAKVNASTTTPEPDEVIRYLDISALRDRGIGELTAMAGAEAPSRARRTVRPGDIAWSMVRPNRRAHALLVEPGEDWVASTGMAVITPTTVPSSYLFEAVSTTEFSDYLVSRESGAAYPAVRPKDFEAATLVAPDPQVLEAFDAVVRPIHAMSWRLGEQGAALAAMRDLLLPKLVAGQIDVRALDPDGPLGIGCA